MSKVEFKNLFQTRIKEMKPNAKSDDDGSSLDIGIFEKMSLLDEV
jgi:hypothetical protein